MVRAIRGAITLDENSKNAVISETSLLLSSIIDNNSIDTSDIISIFFSATPDINAEFPAVAARQIGLVNVPLMCFHEMNVLGGLELCIRVMMHINSDKSQNDIKHVYLKNAQKLRPDLAKSNQ